MRQFLRSVALGVEICAWVILGLIWRRKDREIRRAAERRRLVD